MKKISFYYTILIAVLAGFLIAEDVQARDIFHPEIYVEDSLNVSPTQTFMFMKDPDWEQNWNKYTAPLNGWTKVTLQYDPNFMLQISEGKTNDPIVLLKDNICRSDEYGWEGSRTTYIVRNYPYIDTTTPSNPTGGGSSTVNPSPSTTNPSTSTDKTSDNKKVTATKKKTTAGKIKIETAGCKKGTFRIVIKGAYSPYGISKIKVKVWSKSDKSNLKTYTAKKQKDGTYMVKVKVSKHGKAYGTYKAKATMTDKKKKTVSTGTAKKKIKK